MLQLDLTLLSVTVYSDALALAILYCYSPDVITVQTTAQVVAFCVLCFLVYR